MISLPTAAPLALATLVLCAPPQSHALTVAFDVPANTVGNQSFGGVLAMDFEVLSPITVLELGAFDSGSDGILGTITVELWRRDGNAPLERLEALDFALPEDALRGGSRFRAITPLALMEGQYSIVAYGFSDSDPNGNADGFGSFPGDFPWSLDDGGGALLFTASRFGGTPGSSIGTIPDSTLPPNKYAAGTFAYELGAAGPPAPIPLPPAAGLLLAGLGLLAASRARAEGSPVRRARQVRRPGARGSSAGPHRG